MAYETEHPLIGGASNDTTATANLLSSGVWTIASLASFSGVDYFKVNPTSAGLIKLDFSNKLLTTTNHWNIALLDSNGDYVTTLASSVSGTPVVAGSSNTGTTLAVSGLTSAVPAGSRFTFATSSADTTIFTVVSATTPSGGQSTLTLDTSLPSGLAADTALVFDPAQTLADGGDTSLTAQVSAAGTYYLKISPATWTDAEYRLRATFQPTIESSDENGTKEVAAENDNRLIENAWMTGALSAATDTDVWVFTTATASDFTIAFTAATGNDNAPAWKIDVSQWSGAALLNVQGTDISDKTAGASASYSVDDARYNTATTFVVTVSAYTTAAYSGADYRLRVSGTGLDLNDAPVITVDTVSSANPYDNIDTGVVRSIKAGADAKVALSSLFSVSDADSAQSIASYKVILKKASGETGSVAGSIKLIESDGSASATYSMGTTIDLTAAQMAKAYVLPGAVTGNLSLSVQAFDSSSAPDSSGASSVMTQTLRVVSADVGVTVATDGSLSLVEGDTSSTEAVEVRLATPPTGNVLVYLEQATPSQFTFSSSLLTFTTSNWETAQTVTVRGKDDGTTEGSHSAQISFRVVSADSQYDGFSVSALTVSLADPPNRSPEGSVTISGTVTEDQTLTAVTTTLSDADGLGTLNYQWQRSSDGTSGWTDIGSASSSTYKLGDSDVGKYVRVVVSYVDNRGTAESKASSATAAVANVNDAPSTANVTVTTNEDTAYTFQAANFAFTDVDSGDSLKAVEIQGLPAKGTLKYDGSAVALSGGVYTVLAANIGKLTYSPAADGNGSAYTTFDFKVVDQSGAKSAAKTVTVNVTAVDDAYTGEVAINGTPVSGNTLSLANSLADADGLGTFSYKWQSSTDGSSWSDISGATAATYALTGSEIGKMIRAQVSYTDGGGTANSVNSAASATVKATNNAPTGSVSVSGTATEDQTLTADTSTLSDADGLGAISYQWQRSSDGSAWANISSATANTYALGDTDVGKFLRVVASYTDGGQVAESVPSSATSAVANVNDAPVLASALVDQTGARATSFEYRFASGSFTDADGESLTYTATLESGAALPGWLGFNASTRTFSGTPGSTDTGTISIKVTAKDASGASASDVFALTVPGDTTTLSGKVYFWNKVAARTADNIAAGHVLLDGVTAIVNDAGTAREGATASGGAYSVASIAATTSTVAVSASLAVSTADRATVTLGDALEVLKLYLGKLSSPSPYKYLASDYNADNKVTLTDALGILKSVLNKAGALEPAWVFVDEEANVKGLTKDSATRPTVDAHPVTTDPSLNLVAVLRGDANGSWKPASTASYEVLPDTYFTELVAQHPDTMTTGQFGL